MKRYVFGKSVKGATHEKNGLPLQDNCKIEEISDKITIIAVADGHGSSKCPRSDRGSLIAVNTFCTVMKNYLLNYGKEKDGLTNLVTFLNREGDMRFAQDICEEWQWLCTLKKQIMMILKCRAGYGIFSEEMDLSHWKD